MNSQGTSFIPQRPTQGKIRNRGVRKIYILAYISYVFFFGTSLAAGGLFFYNATLDAQLVHEKELLSAERDKFSQSDIESVRELERRINLAKERMNAHISVVSIFEALEKSSVQSLNFLTFSYKRLNDDAPVISVSGNADTFNKVMYQRDVLNADPILAGGVFSDVSLGSSRSATSSQGPTGEVIKFTFTKAVTPSLIGYVPRTVAPAQNDQNNNDNNDQVNTENTDANANGGGNADQTGSSADAGSGQEQSQNGGGSATGGNQ